MTNSRLQTALTGLWLFPPPAARTAAFAWLNRAGARLAADAGILTIVQRIVRQLAGADVLPDLLFGPIQDGADLVEAVVGIPFHRLCLRVGGGLLMAQARNPRPVARDSALERLYLADAAARLPCFEAVVAPIDALGGDEGFERLRIGVHHAKIALVAALDAAQELISLFREPAGVDREYVNTRDVGPDDVRQDDRFATQAARIDNLPILLDGRGQALAYRGGLLFELEVQQFSHSGADYRRHSPHDRTNGFL